MAENFNVKPYYDDFDPSKNYHRILFKPGFAVQARELTQSQTILQNQISNFADHIFSQNTPVSGGKVTTNVTCHYLKLVPSFGTSQIKASSFLNSDGTGRYITDNETGTVVAKVIAAVEGTAADAPTLIIQYLSGIHFADNITIQTNDSSAVQYATTTSECTGLASTASISNGVFYIVNGYSKTAVGTNYSIGNFVQVNPQTVVVGKYSNKPSVRVGLLITESVVDYTADSGLLDPAIGASNYQAPGADRYQITLTLATLPLEIGNDSNFIELVRIVNGEVITQVDGTVYSTIDDYFAKRDYETNGDYIVSPFTYTPSANTLSPAKYDLSISKGVAYVHGYRIENQSPLKLTTDRARATQSINNNDVFVNYGSYFYVDSMKNFFDVTNMPVVNLHCVSSNNISNSSSAGYNSTAIGTALIRDLVYVTDSGSANSYVFKAYVSDISLKSITTNVAFAVGQTTITLNDPTGLLSGIANSYYNQTLTVTSGTSAGDVRNIVYYNAKSFIVDKPFTVQPDSTSVITITPAVRDIESIVIPGANNSVAASLNINTQFGKSGGIAIGDTVYNNPGAPEMLFQIGNPHVAVTSNSTYQSVKSFAPGSTGASGTFNIFAGTSLNFVGTASSTLGAGLIKQYYTVIDTATGNILDYTTVGSSVTLDSTKQYLTFTNSAYANKTVKVLASVTISNGDAFPILKWKNLVTGVTTSVTTGGTIVDGGVKVDLQKGQAIIPNAAAQTSKISLYVADVKRISKILDTGSTSVQPVTGDITTYTDVTAQYVFNNGQRDTYYDHASIQLLPGANPAQGNLLVVFDYYSHINGSTNLGTGTASDGYFAVGSYVNSTNPESIQNIQSYTATDGITYDLADCLDFRPSRVNATTTFAFENAGGGALMPTDVTSFVSSYSYYLGRKDLLVLSKDKSFQIVEGSPSLNPIPPTQPSGSLLLANLTLEPFTAFVPGENPTGKKANLSINPVAHNRWAKSDITDLQSRVNNLEYYTSLSLLEQNAQSLQIPDSNGINRFKNGILVDDFSSFSTADTFNADFTANINIRKQTLTPVTIVDNFQLQNKIVQASLGTLQNTNTFAVSSLGGTGTNVFTLPYTKANLVIQPLATSAVSLNPFGVTVYQGTASLYPPMDNWVDNIQAPSILITDPNMQVLQQSAGVNLTNAGDFASIPGTEYSTSSTTSTTAPGKRTTTTTTNSYASQLTNITSTLNTKTINSNLNINNGYLTNVSLLPYIRQQQLGFNVKGLLINTPISVWFDGQNIDDYITTPNTIELTGVSGKFNEGDVVGFYQANTFYPTARVEGTYAYPGTTNVRLYVSDVLGMPAYTTTNVVQNGVFNGNGQYVASTAKGSLNAGISSLTSSGTITGVGGGFDINGQTTRLYSIKDSSNWSSFMNQYAIWGDLDRSATYSADFQVIPQVAGTYSYTYASTGGSAGGSTTISANGTTVVSTTTPNYTSATSGTFTVTDAQLGNLLTLALRVTGGNGTPAGTAGIALTIADPKGSIVFATTHPPELAYNFASGEKLMPQGGAWFSGVTSIALDQNAKGPTATYYQGAQIKITSTYVYSFTVETATYVPPPAPSSGGGGGKIICTKLYQLGLMDEEIYKADQAFGELLRETDPAAYYGYIRWATVVVDWMSGTGPQCMFWIKDDAERAKTQQRLAIKWAHRIATPWAEHMAFLMGQRKQDNFAGKIIMNIGKPISKLVNLFPTRKKEAGLATGYTMWAVFGMLYVISKVFGNKMFPKTINS